MTRRPLMALCAALLSTLASACGPVLTFTPRPHPCPRRSEDCAVLVIRERPARDYDVIGVLDVAAPSAKALPSDPGTFLELVRPRVCLAGGDAVIPGIDGDGRYVLGTVVRWRDGRALEVACPPPPKEGEEPKGTDEEKSADSRARREVASC